MEGKRVENNLSGQSMSLGDHLEELRARLILALGGLFIGLVVCLIFGKFLINFMTAPYLDVMEGLGMDERSRLIVLSPAEGFVAYMKIAMIAGLILSSPWVFYQLWMFVAAGLYEHERKYVKIAVPFSVILFVAGAMFFMFIVAPLSLAFLIKFNEKVIGATSSFTFPYYVTFVTTLMLVFGIAFQTPIAIVIISKMGLVSIESLKKARKFVILGIFVLSAAATPPDVVSQVTLAMPLYLLYELGIILSGLLERKKKRALES